MVASILEEVCNENNRTPPGEREASPSFQGFIERLDGSDSRCGGPLIGKDFSRELQGFQTAYAAAPSAPNEPSERREADKKNANRDWRSLIVKLVEMFYDPAFAPASSAPNEPSERKEADRKNATDWWELIVKLVEMFYKIEGSDIKVRMAVMIAVASYLDN